MVALPVNENAAPAQSLLLAVEGPVALLQRLKILGRFSVGWRGEIGQKRLMQARQKG
jgi:hypothetical protein